MGAEIDPATIVPGYKFDVNFMHPAYEVADAERVYSTIQSELHIPYEHNWGVTELPPADGQDPRLETYLGSVTFSLPENEASPLTANIYVKVYGPSIVMRAIARALPFVKPKAKVWANGEGTRPYGGGGGLRRNPKPLVHA